MDVFNGRICAGNLTLVSYRNKASVSYWSAIYVVASDIGVIEFISIQAFYALDQ